MQIEVNCSKTRRTLARVFNPIVPSVGHGFHIDEMNQRTEVHGIVKSVHWDFTNIPSVRIYIQQI